MSDLVAAYIFTSLIALVVLFQIMLACGAPLGHLAMGGRYPGVFPPALRIAALVQAVLLSSFALVVLTKAGLIWPQYYAFAAKAIWFVAAVSGLSFVMNLITPSRWERIIWAPVAAGLLFTSGWLAVVGL